MSTSPSRALSRRSLGRRVGGIAALAGSAAFALPAWAAALGSAVAGPGPYGPLGAPDRHGVRLPAGFIARLLARSGDAVGASGHRWHFAPDGGATFAMPDGGWVYVSNAELSRPAGGASVIRFDVAGQVVDAYPILSSTHLNCAGGATPWGTWLSCEEFTLGQVWECDPRLRGQGVPRAALGVFKHEAAVVDPATGNVYLTEDDENGRLYRFVPVRAGELTAGSLQAALVAPDGAVDWVPVPDKRAYRQADSTPFRRGEGAWFSKGVLYFCSTSDHRVWALDVARNRLRVLYDGRAAGPDAALRDPDNLTVHAPSGDVFVCEDGDNLECVMLAMQAGTPVAAPFLSLVGHDGSELTGVAFSPDGRRMVLSSQRGLAGAKGNPGMTFEVGGPFRGGGR